MAYEAHLRGHYSLSNTQLEKLIKEVPDTPEKDRARLLYGVNLLHLGEYGMAIETLEALRDTPLLKDALTYIMLAYLKKGQPLRALSSYPDYREAFGRSAFIENQIADALFSTSVKMFNKNNFVESRRLFRLLIDNFDDSRHMGEAFYYYGLLFYNENNFTDALKYLERAYDLLHKIENPDIRADIMLKMGDCFFNLRNHAAAKRHYSNVIQDYGNTLYGTWAYFQLSLIEKRRDNLERSMSLLKNIKTARSTDVNFRIINEMANIAMLMENWEDAETYLLQLVEIFPGHEDIPAIHLRLGLVNFNKTAFSKARTYFARAIGGPASPETEERAYFGLGYTYNVEQQHQRAFETWSTLLEKFPQSRFKHEILFVKGQTYYRQGKYEEAEGYLKTLTENFSKSPFYVLAMRTLAETLLKLEKHQECKKHCEEFLKEHQDEHIELLLARAYFLLQNFDAAKNILENASIHNPALKVEKIYYLARIYEYEQDTEAAKEKLLEIITFFKEFEEWVELAEKNLEELAK